MKSMLFTSLGSNESSSSLPASTPFSRNCTVPLFIRDVTVCMTSSTLICGRATFPNRLYPSAAAFRCASEGTISCPSILLITLAAFTVTSFSSTLFAVLPLSTFSCAETGSSRKEDSIINNNFLFAIPICVFCRKDRHCAPVGTKIITDNCLTLHPQPVRPAFPTAWECCSQRLGIMFPTPGNHIPKRSGTTGIHIKMNVIALHCLPFKLPLHQTIKETVWTYRRFTEFTEATRS